MKISNVTEARPIAQSPSGELIATIVNEKLRVSDLQAKGQDREYKIGIDTQDLISVKFSNDDAHLALLSRNRVEVISRDTRSRRLGISNGSGTLGSLTSADFVASTHLLTVWEFGRARVWNIKTGSFIELGDIKTGCEGACWAVRPRVDNWRPTLIYLAKDGADDVLCIRTQSGKLIKSFKLRTTDAQGLSWSPDGRWFAVRDTPVCMSDEGVCFYTPDGNRYMSYPRASHSWTNNLGVKALTWSPASNLVALSGFYGDVVLLDTRTFLPRKTLEHKAVIKQSVTSQGTVEAPIWREMASASSERSYDGIRQPASPVMTRVKQSSEPQELGIAEAAFNSNGNYLATRDERFQSTIWIWDVSRISGTDGESAICISNEDAYDLHAVLMQHRNVRKMQWHPTRPNSLMFDCGEDLVYHFDVGRPTEPPQIINVAPAIKGSATYSWVQVTNDELVIRAATKRKYCLIFPDRAPDAADEEIVDAQPVHMSISGSDLDDSIQDILTGRKPMPVKAQDSYTEFVDLEGDSMAGLDDTFREKKRKAETDEVAFDPLDDSQIF